MKKLIERVNNISLSFTLLTVCFLLTLPNLYKYITNLMMYPNPFSFLYVIQSLIPLFLLVLLYFNSKRDIKKLSSIACLIFGILELYQAYRSVKTVLGYITNGVDLYTYFYFNCIGNLIEYIVCGILLVLTFVKITKGKKFLPSGIVAVLGGIACCLTGLVSIMLGIIAPSISISIASSISNVGLDLLLIIGLYYLPDTLENRETAVMTTFKSVKIIAVLLVIVLLPAFAGVNAGSSSSGNSKVCQVCDRTFTDSTNTESIARTHMCSNCASNYKSINDWLDSMDD